MNAKSPLPLLGRSQASPRSKSTTSIKSKGKADGSILSFFKKTESPQKSDKVVEADDGVLFLPDDTGRKSFDEPLQTPTPPREDANVESGDDTLVRFNENLGVVKRQRTSSNGVMISGFGEVEAVSAEISRTGTRNPAESLVVATQSVKPQLTDAAAIANATSLTRSTKGLNSSGPSPFIEDDSEDESTERLIKEVFGKRPPSPTKHSTLSKPPEKHESGSVAVGDSPDIPSLKREPTSIVDGDAFDGIEDFIEDEFPEDGEEYMERRWMDDQERLELGLEEVDMNDEYSVEDIRDFKGNSPPRVSESQTGSCPICNTSLEGIMPEVGYRDSCYVSTIANLYQTASVHVNNCLDGNPTPLPRVILPVKTEAVESKNGSASHKRFQRAAIARPGQQNPVSLGSSNSHGSSAFSKLMSSHAEDTAWATAAASEMAARGKPAYQRTCPFYKILPGLFICVDAFRYGAVEGCKAYFLSHFHSDHYIGLTSSWCHGPIYCSRVTANLVRRQLRVDPKWVVDLEFDSKVEVPGTQGVDVTMIPANHCPGSSLYLFEKAIGKGKTPKVQRILHCGDFRACPAHVQHPLLRSEIVDAVSGKCTGQQKLDVCYLDTTYLTPKYAFPSQEEVIKACADMCVSLSKEKVDENDDWEQTKKERAGSGMVKFVRKDSTLIKKEEDEDDIDAMKVNTKSGEKRRGRLLVIVGTYSIGKERICLGVARALNSKIYAPANKQKICAALEDPELTSRLTSDPYEAQVHMQMLMEIRAETLADYLTGFKPHFSRIVGFRPSGWNYRPPNSRFVESPAVQTVLHSDTWKSKYSMSELVPQRGSTREASCFGVPYSEHSSFRELTMFCCALRIDKIIPTVNVGSAKSREKMRSWCEKWAQEKKKNGLFKVADGQVAW